MENKTETISQETYEEASIIEKQNRIQLLMEGKTICSLKPSQEEKKEDTDIQKKVQLNTPLVNYEWEISQKIHKIPHNKLYFSTMIEAPIELTIGQLTDDNIENCKNKSQHKNKPENKTLVSTSYKRIQTITIYQYLQTIKSEYPDKSFMTILDIFSQILHIIQKIKDQETPLILFDINEESILYDKQNNVPIVIDHQLVIEKQALEDKEQRHDLIPHYDLPYPSIAIEIWLLSNIIELDPQIQFSKEKLDEYIDQYTQNLPTNPKVNEFIDQYKQELQKIAEWDHLEDSLIESSDSWDLYATAILFYNLCSQLNLDELRIQIDETPKYPFLEEWYKILESIIYTVPSSRPTIKQILEKIETSFTQVDRELYQSFLLEFLE